jgi:hypothetical protein
MKTWIYLLSAFVVFSAGASQGCSKKSAEKAPEQKKVEAPEGAQAEVAGKDGQNQPALDKMPRKIIYTAMINLIVEDFAKADQELIQGQLQLKRFAGKDFYQEFLAPAAGAAFHGDAVLARMLF